MSGFIALEVEIAFSTERVDEETREWLFDNKAKKVRVYKPNKLVERKAARDNWGHLRHIRHVSIWT